MNTVLTTCLRCVRVVTVLTTLVHDFDTFFHGVEYMAMHIHCIEIAIPWKKVFIFEKVANTIKQIVRIVKHKNITKPLKTVESCKKRSKHQ